MSARLAHVRFVVLDVDDTLYLERDYVRSGFQAVEAAAGIAGFAAAAWALFESGVRGDTFDQALAKLGPPHDQVSVAELVRHYRTHAPTIDLSADARLLLDRLHGAGVPLAGVTDGPLESQQAKVAALRLADWSVGVIFTAAYGPGFGKPHPRAFAELAERSGVAPHEHLYVADNPRKDFGGPQELGWSTVRVRRPGSLHEQLDTPESVDAEVRDLHGLAILLGPRSGGPQG